MTEPSPPASTPRDDEKTSFFQSTSFRLGVVGLGVVTIGVLISLANLEPDLSHLDVTVLSGSERGNYRRVVDQMADYAKGRGGVVHNVMTQGSVDNLVQLTQGAEDAETRFALVQDGLEFPTGSSLELVARLTSGEAVFFLAKPELAARVSGFSDLAGKRIGIGPEGSGTASLVKQVFALPGFEALDAQLVHHPVDEQPALIAAGTLDVGVFVIDEDALLIREAVRAQGLALLAFAEIEAVAHAIGPVRIGRVVAGQFDPLRRLPPQTTLLLKVDTLVLSDGSASRSEIVSLLTLLNEHLPGFIEHNREVPNATGLPLAAASRAFIEDGGPSLADEYVPWLVDVFPVSNLVQFAMVISVIFNLMGAGNRFCLWRIDVARVEAEAAIYQLFGRVLSPGEVTGLEPLEAHRSDAWGGRLASVIGDLDALHVRSREQSVGMLVPMGREMSYRYQEHLIGIWTAALRAYQSKLSRVQS